MILLLVIAAVIAFFIYYVLNLDFEPGTGFTEIKDKAREGEYSITKTKEDEVKAHKRLDSPE